MSEQTLSKKWHPVAYNRETTRWVEAVTLGHVSMDELVLRYNGLMEQLAAAREHAAISIARAASDGLAKETATAEAAKLAALLARYAALLERLYQWDIMSAGGDGAYWKREIDALLAARDPQAAVTAEPPQAGTGDSP